MAAEESSDEDWEECDNENEDFKTKCLFCTSLFKTSKDAIVHCKADHHFSLAEVKERFKMDYYDFVKMINFIRSTGALPADVTECDEAPWQDEQYLKCVLNEDAILCFDFDSVEDLLAAEKGKVPSETPFAQQLEQAQAECVMYRQSLHKVVTELEMVKSRAAELMTNQETETGSTSSASDDYFVSYSDYSIHEEMLKDSVRTLSYANFIMRNEELFNGKTVLDVGCGTAILSLMAARAGANTVYAVDNSTIIFEAMDIVRQNHLDQSIQCIHGNITTVELSKVDVIISEWMGYGLLFESMLDAVIVARDRFLKDSTQIYPNSSSLYIAGLSNEKLFADKVTFWDSVYGFQMSCMKAKVVSECHIVSVGAKDLCTEPIVIKTFDISTIQVEDLQFTVPFHLLSNQNGNLHGFVIYFDVSFVPPSQKGCVITMTTSPEAPPTHWKQTILLISKPCGITSKEGIHGNLSYHKCHNDPRSIEIEISYSTKTTSETCTFVMSR